jgi:hypothetical protein
MGVVWIYFAILLSFIALINPSILVICIILLIKYFNWILSSLRKRILKIQRKNIRKFL